VAYVIHHVATVTLVLASAHLGCSRIGGVIMFFFDWADPPMMIGKSFLYLSLDPTDFCQWIADRCIEVFVVVFIVTRNIVFSYITWICFQTFPNDSWPMIGLKGMLLVLVSLMTFWFCLILKIIHHQFFQNQGNVDDIREREDNDTHAIHTTKKKQ
jgi:ceramide synthetase